MKITDILPRASTIENGRAALFIADSDFDYAGLPILKDALVFYVGKQRLTINLVLYGIFQKRNIPHLVSAQLPSYDQFPHSVDRTSDCPDEDYRLRNSDWGLWHNDHFDAWTTGCFSDYIDRIVNGPSLQFEDIRFSSIAYEFNNTRRSLNHYVTTDNVHIKLHDHSLVIPSFHEVEMTPGDETSIFVTPIDKNPNSPYEVFKYHGIPFHRFIYTDDNGLLAGNLGQEIVVNVLDDSRHKRLTLAKHFRVMVAPNGDLYTRYASTDDLSKIETHQIRLSNGSNA